MLNTDTFTGEPLHMHDAGHLYTFHPKLGFRTKKPKTIRAPIDSPSPRVSITVDKRVMDALGVEIGAARVGSFIQVLLKDWIAGKVQEHKQQYV